MEAAYASVAMSLFKPLNSYGRRLIMNRKTVVLEYGALILGAFIIGFAIKNLYDPVNLVTGGVSGISIIAKELWGIPLWITNIILNIPLFLFSIKIKGWRFIKRTLVSTLSLSLSLYILPEMYFLTDDIFLAALFGGIITGVGTGLVFLAQATTGGTDMLAALIQRKLRHYSIAQVMQILDAVIVLAGASVFGIRYALYALIAIYAVAKISDGMIEGLHFAKQAYIISDKSQEIAGAIMEQLERGVTAVDAVGMFSGQPKKLLYCVVSKKEIVLLKEIVEESDPDAFVIVSEAKEVVGEGFIKYRQ